MLLAPAKLLETVRRGVEWRWGGCWLCIAFVVMYPTHIRTHLLYECSPVDGGPVRVPRPCFTVVLLARSAPRTCWAPPDSNKLILVLSDRRNVLPVFIRRPRVLWQKFHLSIFLHFASWMASCNMLILCTILHTVQSVTETVPTEQVRKH